MNSSSATGATQSNTSSDFLASTTDLVKFTLGPSLSVMVSTVPTTTVESLNATVTRRRAVQQLSGGNEGKIIGGIIGGLFLVAVLILVGLAIYFNKRRLRRFFGRLRKRNKRKHERTFTDLGKNSFVNPSYSPDKTPTNSTADLKKNSRAQMYQVQYDNSAPYKSPKREKPKVNRSKKLRQQASLPLSVEVIPPPTQNKLPSQVQELSSYSRELPPPRNSFPSSSTPSAAPPFSYRSTADRSPSPPPEVDWSSIDLDLSYGR